MSAKVNISGIGSFIGKAISIVNGVISVDGVDVTDLKLVKLPKVDIQIVGNVDSLSVDNAQSVSVDGDAKTVSAVNADIVIHGDVTGPVTNTNGDISANSIVGPVSTINGDISR